MATAAQLLELKTLLESHKAALEDIEPVDDVKDELAAVNSNYNRVGYQIDIIKGILTSTSMTDAEKLQQISDTLGPQDQ